MLDCARSWLKQHTCHGLWVPRDWVHRCGAAVTQAWPASCATQGSHVRHWLSAGRWVPRLAVQQGAPASHHPNHEFLQAGQSCMLGHRAVPRGYIMCGTGCRRLGGRRALQYSRMRQSGTRTITLCLLRVESNSSTASVCRVRRRPASDLGAMTPKPPTTTRKRHLLIGFANGLKKRIRPLEIKNHISAPKQAAP